MTSHDNQVDCRINASSLVCRHLHLTPPLSVSYMRQWTGVSFGCSDNGLSPIQRQAII